MTVVPIEMRPSEWVFAPAIYDVETGETIASLEGGTSSIGALISEGWSLDSARWQSDSAVVLTVRRYPGTVPAIEVHVDCARRTVTVGTRQRSLDHLGFALEASQRDGEATSQLERVILDTLGFTRRHDQDDVASELESALARVQAGDHPGHALRVLYLPTGALQETAVSGGWGDEYLVLASRFDHAYRAWNAWARPPDPTPARTVTRRLRRERRATQARVLALITTTTLALGGGAWVGGGLGVVGMMALVAALATPILTSLARFVRDPVGYLLRGPQTLRSRLRAAASRPRSLAAFVGLCILAAVLAFGGAAALVVGAREKWGG